MRDKAPPPWLERILLHFLSARDRETISGDLLEEYRDEQVLRSGSLRANLWYLRQVLSLMPVWDFVGPPVERLSRWMCALTAGAGIWLAVMENILKHDGYAGRMVIAAAILLQSVVTLLLRGLAGCFIVRVFIAVGAIAAALWGALGIHRILASPHFEGFVLLIGVALLSEGVLTLMAVLRPRRARAL